MMMWIVLLAVKEVIYVRKIRLFRINIEDTRRMTESSRIRNTGLTDRKVKLNSKKFS